MSQFLSDVVHKVQAAAETAPCAACSTKDGILRYNCAMCNRDGFCFHCSNYCVVERSEQILKTNKEKLDEAKESGKALLQSTWAKLKQAKEKAQQRYRERQQKANGEAPATAEGAAVEENTTGGLQDDSHNAAVNADHDEDGRPTVPCYRVASVCRECFRNSIRDKIDLSSVFEIIDITTAEKEDGALTSQELCESTSEAAVVLGLHAACNCRKQLRSLAKSIVRGAPNTWVVLIDLPGHGGRMDEQPIDRQSAMEAIALALEKVIVPLEGALGVNKGASREDLLVAVQQAIQPITVPEHRANPFEFKHRHGSKQQLDASTVAPSAPNNSFADGAVAGSTLTVPSRSVANSGNIRRVLLGNGFGSYMGMEFIGAYPEQFDAAIMLNCGYAVGVEDTTGLSTAVLQLAMETSKFVGSKSLVQSFLSDLNAKAIRGSLNYTNAHADLIDCGTFYQASDDQLRALRTVSTRKSMHNYSGPVLFLDGVYDSSKNIVQDVTNVAVDNEIVRNNRLKRGLTNPEEEGAATSGDDEEEGAGRQILSRAIHYPKGSRFFIHDSRFQNEVSSDIRLFITQLHQQPFAPFESLKTPSKVAVGRGSAPKQVVESPAPRSDAPQAVIPSVTATSKAPVAASSEVTQQSVAETSPVAEKKAKKAKVVAATVEVVAEVAPVQETTAPVEEEQKEVAAAEVAPAVEGEEVAAEVAPVQETTAPVEEEQEEVAAAEVAPAVEEEEVAAEVAAEDTTAPAEEEGTNEEVGDSPAEEADTGAQGGASKKKKGKGKKGGRK